MRLPPGLLVFDANENDRPGFLAIFLAYFSFLLLISIAPALL